MGKSEATETRQEKPKDESVWMIRGRCPHCGGAMSSNGRWAWCLDSGAEFDVDTPEVDLTPVDPTQTEEPRS